MIFANIVPPRNPIEGGYTQNYIDFLTNYKKKYNSTPGSSNQNSYDALYLIAYAIVKAQSTNHADIYHIFKNTNTGTEKINVNEFAKAKEFIENQKTIRYEGASGDLTFSDEGIIRNAWYGIDSVANNKFVNFLYLPYNGKK